MDVNRQTPDPTGLRARSAAPTHTIAPRRQRFREWIFGLLRSFGYAGAGIVQLLRRQRNAQIHLVITLAACIAAWVWRLSRIEWLVLIVTIALVIGMEALNTAIEAVVDLASPRYHPLAKQAKDVAAGAVLLVAICAVAVGILLFGSHLLDLLWWLLD